MPNKFKTSILLLTLLISVNTQVFGENIFDPALGELVLPVTRINDSSAFTTRWTLVSRSPLVFALTGASPVVKESRSAAIYMPDSGRVWIPEININGRLYSLGFNRITENCDAPYCLSPDLSSVENAGRSGAVIFTTPVSSASTFSCSSCHAVSETNGLAADGFRRPGHPLLNAPRRPHYKNGKLDTLLDAVNTCLTEWMNTSPWTDSDPDWINLSNWLEDQSTVTEAEPVSISVVLPPEDPAGGDALTGRDLFNSRCIVCHGENGQGTERAPKVTGTGLTAGYIARRVRTSGVIDSQVYTGLTGGIMPFWGNDRLNDGELVDIIAYLTNTETELEDLGEGGTSMSGCTKDHPSVGYEAELDGHFHNVSGTAVIVDDCTIELRNFNFDGGGIDVRVYAGTGGMYQPADGGFALSDDIVGMRFENATLQITLKDGVTFDDFDSISIWCVAVGISFGDGRFRNAGVINPLGG